MVVVAANAGMTFQTGGKTPGNVSRAAAGGAKSRAKKRMPGFVIFASGADYATDCGKNGKASVNMSKAPSTGVKSRAKKPT